MNKAIIEETGEVIEMMTEVEAERVTSRIADKLDAIADAHEQVLPLIGEAMTRQAWKALGYQSPQSYVSERFGRALERLNAPVRRAFVAELSEAGMSTRSIAPIVGTHHDTVARDIRKSSVVNPTVTQTRPTPSADSPATPETAETTEHGLPVSEHIIDRRGYKHSRPEPRPEPAKPKADPITAQFSAAVVELNKVLDKFHRIQSSPNFPANKNQVATLHGSDLARSVSELQNLADQLH